MGFTVLPPDPTYEQLTMPWDPRLVPPDHSGPRHSFEARIERLANRLQNPPRTLREGITQDTSGIHVMPEPGGFSLRKLRSGQLNSNIPVMEPYQSSGGAPVTRMNPSSPGTLVDQMRQANEFDSRYGRWVGT